jgi:anti-sigma factor RsiW
MNDPGSNHLSSDALLACLDGTLPDTDSRAVRAHLSTCHRCARALESLREFDASARSIPAEKADERMHRSIMLRLGISPKESLFVRAVAGLPYAFALLIVGGILLAVFAWTGALPESTTSVPGQLGSGLTAVGDVTRQAYADVLGFIARVLPGVSSSGVRVGIGVGLVLMAIALVDRFFPWRPVQRIQ